MEKIIQEWRVQSWTSDAVYTVKREGSKWSCTCYYFQTNKKQCKHITQKKQELGLIKPDLSHYRSAIQKAIRRGDLSLLKKCFFKLWEEDNSWLIWRLPVLACEENWPYSGLAVEMALDKEVKREQVWKLLANLTLKPKNKEAEAIAELFYLYEKGFDVRKYIEDEAKLRIFNEILEIKEKKQLWKEDKEKYWELYSEPFSEVSKNFFNQMKRRINYAGPDYMFVVAAYFSTIYGLEEVTLDEVPNEESIEPVEELQWFVYDMHTSIGKQVYYQLKKAFGEEMGEYIGNELWWFEESAVCDRLVDDSWWWLKNREIWYRMRGKTVGQVEKDWEVWRHEIKKRIVEKIIARKKAFNGI